MSSTTTVAQFAAELNKSTTTLIEHLASAGVVKSSASDALSESDKQKLLGFLQASHGTASTERKKITLVKKSTSEIKQADATGRARVMDFGIAARLDTGSDPLAGCIVGTPGYLSPEAAAAAAPGNPLDSCESACDTRS